MCDAAMTQITTAKEKAGAIKATGKASLREYPPKKRPPPVKVEAQRRTLGEEERTPCVIRPEEGERARMGLRSEVVIPAPGENEEGGSPATEPSASTMKAPP